MKLEANGHKINKGYSSKNLLCCVLITIATAFPRQDLHPFDLSDHVSYIIKGGVEVKGSGHLIPGGGRIDPRQMRLAMKRMGMQTEELDDVSEVIIRRAGSELRFVKPSVVYIKVSGQHIYQIIGEPQTAEPTSSTAGTDTPSLNKEDLELVMSQTGCSEDEARQALLNSDGQPASAIIWILSHRKG